MSHVRAALLYIRRMASQVRQRWIRGMIRIGISAVLLLVFALHIQGTQHYVLIDRIESYLYDALLRLTMPNTIDDRIVIVKIDEASLSVLG